MTIELFSSSSFEAIWKMKSDVWVLINPDENHWTEKLDWHLGLLLRRSLQRIEKRSAGFSDALLLATPEGLPSPRVLVLSLSAGSDASRNSEWLPVLGAHLSGLKVQTATVFPPADWRPPQPKQLAEVSQGEWGIRWVESAN
ncbi:MAG: hypothetical protein J0L82_08325 [Deltaproteobacteria bacterium]|jgi:hypothetical protein|nr:hypothetical protein [Deltaproteobacteria bacterium]